MSVENLKEDIVRDFKFKDKRFQHKEVTVRLLFIEQSLKNSKKLIDTKKPYLDSFVKSYKENNQTNLLEAEGLKDDVERILNEMYLIFINKDPLLRAQSIIPIIYLLFRAAIYQNLLSTITRIKFDNFRKDIQKNREIAESDITNANFDLLEFDRLSQQGTNDVSSIKERFRIMAEYFKIQPIIQV